MRQLLVVTLFCCAQHGASRRGARRSPYDEFKDAVLKGHALTAQRLLDQGANPNHYDKYFHPLTEAAFQNRPSMIDILLRGGAEVDGRDYNNMTALHVASELGFTNVVQRLLDAGAGVDEKTTMSERTNVTALHLAAGKGHVAAVKILLERGATHLADDIGYTPLFYAASAGFDRVVKILLQSGASPKTRANVNRANVGGLGPHHVAVKTGKVATLKLLLDAGAGIDDRTAIGSTPLMLAASRGDVKVIKYLLSRGADPTLRALPPYTARTAAQTARKRKHRVAAELLDKAEVAWNAKRRKLVVFAVVFFASGWLVFLFIAARMVDDDDPIGRDLRWTQDKFSAFITRLLGVVTPLATPLVSLATLVGHAVAFPVRFLQNLHQKMADASAVAAADRAANELLETDDAQRPSRRDGARPGLRRRARGRRRDVTPRATAAAPETVEPQTVEPEAEPEPVADSAPQGPEPVSAVEPEPGSPTRVETSPPEPTSVPAELRAAAVAAPVPESKAEEPLAPESKREAPEALAVPVGFEKVAHILEAHGESRLLATLVEQQIDDTTLPLLEASDLLELGVSPMAILAILDASSGARGKSKKLATDDALDVAKHQSVLEEELREHRAELERLRISREEFPADMCCAITCELMKDPFMCVGDGNTYERVAIEQWFSTGARTSPTTNERLDNLTLVPNLTVKRLIAAELERRRGT